MSDLTIKNLGTIKKILMHFKVYNVVIGNVKLKFLVYKCGVPR